MRESDAGCVELSFAKLQRLRRSFEEVGMLDHPQRRTLMRLVRDLGVTALPLCIRALESAGMSNEPRASLAGSLISHLGESDEHRPRVIAALTSLIQKTGVGDPAKLRALSLLAELGGDPPEGARLDDASSAEEHSVRELASLLSTAPEIARAGDMLVCRLRGDEMLALVDALSTREPRRTVPLIDELLLRNDIDEHGRRQLKRIRAPLRDRQKRQTPPPGRQPVATALIGCHANGSHIVVSSRRVLGRPSRQYRGLCLLVSVDGQLSDGMYREDFPLGGIEREVLRPLCRQGYRFETKSSAEAATLIIRAAQAARRLGRRLPRAFYLGRDLLDIFDEHAAGIGLADDSDLEALLDRANALLASGESKRARPLFERYVAQVPDSADGCAGLAMCLIAMGDDNGARAHLRRAIWLEPTNPNHHWNLAAIAHRQGRLGGCYLALLDYLEYAGDFDEAPGDASERIQIATGFVDEYERIARIEYRGMSTAAVAHADELLYRAKKRLDGEQYEDAIAVLEQAVSVVPEHYPSLAFLGIAHGNFGQIDQARSYLHRALEVRPGFAPAVEALRRLERLACKPPMRAQSRRGAKPDADLATPYLGSNT